jgi:hypothetical protein
MVESNDLRSDNTTNGEGESDGRRRVHEGLGGQPRDRAHGHRTNVWPGDLQPQWFVWEGEKLYLVPVKGSDADWYKNVLKTPTIRLAAGGAQLSASASPISDAAKVDQVLDRFRAKYGAQDVETYYPKQDVAVEVPLA